MGLLKSFTNKWNRKKGKQEELTQEQIGEWEKTGISRKGVDILDEAQRERYVKACLEQLAEASKELEVLEEEYNLVTSYLTDMEEIDSMAPELKAQLTGYAKQIIEIEKNQQQKKERKSLISEAEFAHMERIAEYMPKGYDKLKEAEEYQVLVKKDLGRLDAERYSYQYRRNELENSQKNMKGMTVICIASMVVLMIVLSVLSSVLKMDVQIGYLIAVLITACALTLVYVKFGDAQRELVRVDKAMNKLVLLQNTVKIRYVNNTNLLEYLYVKYDVKNAAELKKLWEKYQSENKQREEEARLRKDMEFSQAALVKLLQRCKIQDPNIWLHQVNAIVDNKEMVEIRHGLIIRRQKLRKQMEYNAKNAQDAQDEVKDLVQKYPTHAQDILNIVAEYEKALA